MDPLLKTPTAPSREQDEPPGDGGGLPPPRFPGNGRRRRGDDGSLPLVKIGDPLRLTYQDGAVDALFQAMQYLQHKPSGASSATLVSTVEAINDSLDEATRSRISRYALELDNKKLFPITAFCLGTLFGVSQRFSEIAGLQKSITKLHDKLGLMALECELYVGRNNLDRSCLNWVEVAPFTTVNLYSNDRHRARGGDAPTEDQRLEPVRAAVLQLLEGGVPRSFNEFMRCRVSDLLMTAQDTSQRRRSMALLYGYCAAPTLDEWLWGDKYTSRMLAGIMANTRLFDTEAFLQQDATGTKGLGLPRQHVELVQAGVLLSHVDVPPGRQRLLDAVLVSHASSTLHEVPGTDTNWMEREMLVNQLINDVRDLGERGEAVAPGAARHMADLLLLDHAQHHAKHLDLSNPMGNGYGRGATLGWLRVATRECDAAAQRLRRAETAIDSPLTRYGFDRSVLDVPQQLQTLQQAFDARLEAEITRTNLPRPS